MAVSRVQGINELKATFRRKGKNIKKVKDIVKLNASELTEEAQRLAPVDTGFMKNSIVFKLSNGGLTATIQAHTEYDIYVELGTRFMQAQPFLTPATMKQRVKFFKDIRELVEK